MNKTWLYTGTYTREEPHALDAHGPGLVTFAFDSSTGQLEQQHVVADQINASYLAVDYVNGWLFSTQESFGIENEVHMFRRNHDGSLTRTGAQPSNGMATCHVSLLPDGSVCASSYADGLISVLQVREGQLQPVGYQHRYHGSGPDLRRQEASHAHSATVAPDQRWLYVCDLGGDRIWCHGLEAGNISQTDPVGIPTPPGCGPRHMAFHPSKPRVYVLCELTGQVLTFEWEAQSGALILIHDVSSCPNREVQHASCAALRVHPSGNVLYVSDRRDSHLVAFNLDNNGLPLLERRFSTHGTEPRDFGIDPTGRWLVAANQLSDTLAVFELDASSGHLVPGEPSMVSLNSPACVLFVAGSS